MHNNENMQINEAVVSKGFVPADYSVSSDSFGEFLTKSAASQFNGSITIHDITTIFPKVNKYNVLRQYCLQVFTDSSSVEVPCTKDVVLSTDDREASSKVSRPISISLSDEYAKWLIPRSLFHKISGYTEYLKHVFSDGISALEKKLFVNGSLDANTSGILSSLSHKLSLVGSTFSASSLLALKFRLPERYRRDAVFLMSSSMLQVISSVTDQNGRFLFDGVDKIFGHKVEVIDELDDVVLFSDFKQSTVIVERRNPKIEMHSSFDNPSVVGLSLPVSVGIGVINDDAIVCERFELNAYPMHFSEAEDTVSGKSSSNAKVNTNTNTVV